MASNGSNKKSKTSAIQQKGKATQQNVSKNSNNKSVAGSIKDAASNAKAAAKKGVSAIKETAKEAASTIKENAQEQVNKQYYVPFLQKDRPAALFVDSSFSKSEGDIAPQYEGEEGLLAPSLFNRFALYNYRGFNGGFAPSLADYYTDKNNQSSKFRSKTQESETTGISESNQENVLNVNNINEKNVVTYYNDNFPNIPYTPNDFLYNKYFQQIPVNHLITLRRFSMPCEDNIFLPELKQLSVCTATTYFGETTENKLEEILHFSNVGIGWEEKTAQIQEIQAGNKASGGGIFDKGAGRILGSTMAGLSASSLYKSDHFGGNDPALRYDQFVLGPVNVIDKTHIRSRGISFSNDFSLNFHYELKSWYLMNPKIAMLDLLSNMLIMTTNNGDFWGGSWRYSGGMSQSKITDLYGDASLLRSGDFVGYAGSLVHDVIHGNGKGVKGVTGLFGDGNGGFSIKSIFTGVGEILQNLLQGKIGDFLDGLSGGQQNAASEIPKALLSGQPTGYWHVVVGNPLNPIAIMGNMICDKGGDFTLGGGLGYDDFPMEFNCKVALKHGKPRDRSDIESMFNAGQGRIYSPPAEGEDLANISGQEVEEYGVISDGFGMHKYKESDSIIDRTSKSTNGGFTKEHISNAIALTFK